jgi:hypothetical protein
VEPLWRAAGEPIVDGFRVHMARGDSWWSQDFAGGEYFGDVIESAVARCLATGDCIEDRLLVTIVARAAGDAGDQASPGFDAAEKPQELDIRDRAFASTVAASGACGERDDEDVEAVVPGAVIEEIATLTRDAGGRETGGVLMGHLCRDQPPRAVGIEVTAQIAARHAIGHEVRLTFTSETWTDVRDAIALRGAGELLLGWWHSHPALAWCAACPPERQRTCRLATGFLSAHDRALHRAMFPAALSLALVVTNSIAGLDTKMFGWRRGVLQPRAFRVRGEARGRVPPDRREPHRREELEACPLDLPLAVEPASDRPGADAGTREPVADRRGLRTALRRS